VRNVGEGSLWGGEIGAPSDAMLKRALPPKVGSSLGSGQAITSSFGIPKRLVA
jgi:hypothetical protein